MTRIILVSGKGGVGKTTVAAATAIALAGRGRRTLVISFDLAHSLSDSFDLQRGLFDQNKGLPLRVADNLEMQEIDIQEEIQRTWHAFNEYISRLLAMVGLTDVVAEELAIFPGLEDVIALMYLNQYVREDRYNTIVVDCPPTGESLRFISVTATLDWYIHRRYKRDRTLTRLIRPLAHRFSEAPLPGDDFYEFLYTIFQRLEGIDRLLVDPKVTTVRLVTNAEKMVVRETQRAFMYFSMYGVTCDSVIVNRLFSAEMGFTSDWIHDPT